MTGAFSGVHGSGLSVFGEMVVRAGGCWMEVSSSSEIGGGDSMSIGVKGQGVVGGGVLGWGAPWWFK